MPNIVRTVYGSELQTALLTKIAHTLRANTTLNERFNIQSGVLPASSDVPRLGYFGVGIGGHAYTTGSDGIPLSQVRTHSPTDAAPYIPIPFVLRTTDNDLNSGERAAYALRRAETHDGVNYFAYYLKRMNLTGVSIALQYKTVEDGVTTITPFVPDSSNLNPVPPELDNSGVNVTTGDYVSASAVVPVIFTANDAAELRNAANVIYGDEGYSLISEIALCSGVDKTVSAGSFNFNEAIAVQVISFVAALFPAAFSTEGTTFLLDVGATEPLFTLL